MSCQVGRVRGDAQRILAATGDKLLDGDDLFVCARSPRVIVLHHEGWIFDVSA